MAKLWSAHLRQQWTEALKSMPPGLPSAVKVMVGEEISANTVIITLTLAWLFLLVSRICLGAKKRLPPTIPGGLPLLGNLLQLTEKKPHRTFTTWAHEHGPIFTIQVGQIFQVVINNSDIAKEAMVTKYASISSRKMPFALRTLTRDKTMVAMSDYGVEHRMLKKILTSNLLGPNTQTKNRDMRDEALTGMLDGVLAELHSFPNFTGVIDVRRYIEKALFPFAMTQVWGYVPDDVEVPELGVRMGTWEIFQALVVDPLHAVIDIDWRDFFPALRWIPNRRVENEVRSVDYRRNCIMKALIRAQRQRPSYLQGGASRYYADYVIGEATQLTEKQVEMSLWEPIIESSDTTLVTSEWAMYELAKDPKCQEKLLREIESVVGMERMVTEDDLPKMPYLKAVIKETLRQHPPVPIVPSRLVEEDITLGGYDVPKGSQLLVNLYAIAKDPAVWSNPEVWDPERLLGQDNVDMGFKNFQLMPFGAGKRMCAGISQAMSIIPMNVAALVQHCEWRLSPAELEGMDQRLDDVVYLTTHKLRPLTCVGTPRFSSRLP